MEEIVRFIHEAGSLKYVPRSGWLKLGIKMPESVAEHTFRTALIAFIIALRNGESYDVACRAAAAALFHDMHEARVMDLHKVAKEYVDVDVDRVLADQLSSLGIEIDFSDVYKYVRDADRLELSFQAVEYAEVYRHAISFAENVEFETKVAEELYLTLMKRKDPRWWKD